MDSGCGSWLEGRLEERLKKRIASLENSLSHYSAIEEAAKVIAESTMQEAVLMRRMDFSAKAEENMRKHATPEDIAVLTILKAGLVAIAKDMGWRDGWPDGETEYMVRRTG